MSTTTVGDLLQIARRAAESLHDSATPVSALEWQRVDHALYRLLDTLAYPVVPTVDDRAIQARLNRIRDGYPLPLTSSRGRPGHTPLQFAREFGMDLADVHHRIQAGTLPAARDGHGRWRVGTDGDTALPDLAPADATSRAPIDRVAVALSTVTDLLVAEITSADTGLPAPGAGDRACLASYALGIAAVAARHALGHLALADVDRPLLIGRYAERALDALAGDGQGPGALAELASFHPSEHPATGNERLEAALRAWAVAARNEVSQDIPSVAVLADITSQAAQLYAVAHHLTGVASALGWLPRDTSGHAQADFRAAATTFGAATASWKRFTTGQRPTHAYTGAAIALHTTLQDLTHDGDALLSPQVQAKRLDLPRGLTDLRYTGTHLIELVHSSERFPVNLACSGVLFAPARTLRATPERLYAIARGRFDAADLTDVKSLVEVTHEVTVAARRARSSLAHTAGPHTGREPQALLLRRSAPVPAPPAPALTPSL